MIQFGSKRLFVLEEGSNARYIIHEWPQMVFVKEKRIQGKHISDEKPRNHL